MSRRAHTGAVLLIAALAGLLFAGCQPVGSAKPVASTTTAPANPIGSTTSVPAASTTAGAPLNTSSTAEPGSAPSSTAPVTATTTAPVVPALLCTIGVTTGPGDAGAGSRFEPIIFTNLGATPCRLTGNARLEYLAADGKTAIGQGFTIAGGRGVLEAGKTITTTMRTTDTTNIDEVNCKPQPATGLRVWPPAEADPTVLRSPNATACADGGPLDALPLPDPGYTGEGPG